VRTQFLARRVGVALVALAPMAVSPALAQTPKDVTVVNTETNPLPVRNVDQEGRQPFQAQIEFQIDLADFAFGEAEIPEGKRLVIEYASVFVYGVAEQAWVTSGSVSHYLAPSIVPGPSGYTVASQPLRLYAEGSVRLTVLSAIPPFIPIQVTGSISGYLVDVP